MARNSKDLRIFLRTVAELTGLNRLREAVRGHSRVARTFGQAYHAAASVAQGGFRMLQRELRLARNVALGAVGALTVAVREGAAFNLQMARAWTMSNQGIAGFRAWRREITDLSASLGVARSALADGLYQALSAGVPEDNVMSFLATAAKVAVADGSDIATAVDGITTVLNAFGVEADKTDAVVDQLFNTVRNGKTTFGELASNIATAAPAAAAAGMQFEEMLAAVATLTKQGTPTAQAMTQIRASIQALNETYGESWREQMTYLEGLSRLRQEAADSDDTLKSFVGRTEAMMAVLGLTGANARQAAEDLRSTADAAGSLQGAFEKVDQFRHWQVTWTSIRAIVSDIGTEIEDRWAGRIRYIAAQINEMRKGEGFTNLVDNLANKLERTITWVIVQVQTAADLIQHLREGDFGIASIAEVLKTIVVELITLAVTLLLAQLRAATSVFIGLAKVIAGAFQAEILKIPLPGIGGERVARRRAQERLAGMTPDEAQAAGVDPRMAGQQDLLMSPARARERQRQIEDWAQSMDRDAAIAFATGGDDQRMQAAFDQARARMSGIGADLSGQWGQSSDRIKAATRRATGGAFDWDVRAGANRQTVEGFMSDLPPATAPGAAVPVASAPASAPSAADRRTSAQIDAAADAAEETAALLSDSTAHLERAFSALRQSAQDANERARNMMVG